MKIKTRESINAKRQEGVEMWRKLAAKQPTLAAVLGIVLPNSPDQPAYVGPDEMHHPLLVVDFGSTRSDAKQFNGWLWECYHQDSINDRCWWPKRSAGGTATKDHRYLVYFLRSYDERNFGDLEILRAGVARANNYAQQCRLEMLDRDLQRIHSDAETELKELEAEERFYDRLVSRYGAAPLMEASPF